MLCSITFVTCEVRDLTLKITFMANSKRGFVPRVQVLRVFILSTQIEVARLLCAHFLAYLGICQFESDVFFCSQADDSSLLQGRS